MEGHSLTYKQFISQGSTTEQSHRCYVCAPATEIKAESLLCFSKVKFKKVTFLFCFTFVSLTKVAQFYEPLLKRPIGN